jgi:hypothetical protein
MAFINQEAIQELNIALEVLMPEDFGSGVDVITTLSIDSIVPTGLGGFVEPTTEGSAYIHGRRIEARYTVFLQGNLTRLPELQAGVSAITEALLAAEPEIMQANGILKMAQTGSDFQSLGGISREFKLTFDLVYEYLQEPEDIEEVIEEIPVTLALDAES